MLLDVFFLLLSVILSELQKKVHKRICVRDITFLVAHPPSYVLFCRFFPLFPPPFQVTYLLKDLCKDP